MKYSVFATALAFGLVAAGSTDAAVTVTDAAVTVTEAKGYNAWPMIQAQGGRLVLAYSRGTAHSVNEGVRGVYVKTSDDGGRTWSDETLLVDDPTVGEAAEGIGLDTDGSLLLWVRNWSSRKDHRHVLYRSRDGKAFEAVSEIRPDPMPMQVMDIVRVPGGGLASFWFSAGYDYVKGGVKSWGILTSADHGKTWTQRVIETDLTREEWPTEPSAVWLDEKRVLAVARSEAQTRYQFQLTSVDGGRTWRKEKTNITDVQESTPSLIYDRSSGLVYNYYYQRGARRLKRRVVSADFIFTHPTEWPAPRTYFKGHEARAFDAGNVKATALRDVHFAATYTGSTSDTAIVVVPVPADGK